VRNELAHRRITIFDTTLRDGEQSPGIALSPEEKAEIARALERLGVDVIEAGFAISSPGDFEGVRAVARAVSAPTVASLARTRKEDLDAALESLGGSRARTRLHTFIATSPIHMERKLGLEPEEVVEQTRYAVSYGRPYVDEVEFSAKMPRAPPSSLASARPPSTRARPRSTSRIRSATASPRSTPPSCATSGSAAPISTA
jgi:2-isopropylmalate synthase